MTSDSPRSCASKSRSTAVFILGSRNGSARFLRRGARNFSIAGSSLKPRLSRHCASSGEILSDDASVPASSGCGGAIVQRNFIFYSTTDGHGSKEASITKLQPPEKLQIPNINRPSPLCLDVEV